jgi:hypothetical protein
MPPPGELASSKLSPIRRPAPAPWRRTGLQRTAGARSRRRGPRRRTRSPIARFFHGAVARIGADWHAGSRWIVIHLAADRRCRPVTRILSPGQHGDCPRFIPLMESIRIGRRGRDGPAPGPAPRWATRPTSFAANRAYLRRRGIQAVIPVKEDQKAHRRNRGSAGGRPPAFDRGRYKGTQHGRTLLQQAQAVPCRRHAL